MVRKEVINILQGTERKKLENNGIVEVIYSLGLKKVAQTEIVKEDYKQRKQEEQCQGELKDNETCWFKINDAPGWKRQQQKQTNTPGKFGKAFGRIWSQSCQNRTP